MIDTRTGEEVSSRIVAIVLVPFFIAHFGGFTLGHGLFIWALFAPSETIPEIANNLGISMLFLLVLYFVSHGVSYFKNFIGNGEYKKRNPIIFMLLPYRRIFIIHIVLICGGAVLVSVNLPGAILNTVIVSVKTVLDYYSHRKEHEMLSK